MKILLLPGSVCTWNLHCIFPWWNIKHYCERNQSLCNSLYEIGRKCSPKKRICICEVACMSLRNLQKYSLYLLVHIFAVQTIYKSTDINSCVMVVSKHRIENRRAGTECPCTLTVTYLLCSPWYHSFSSLAHWAKWWQRCLESHRFL
jgi:hypothetical protein